MKVINRSQFNLSHALEKEVKLKDGTIRIEQQPYFLPIGATLEIPDEIAKIWLKFKGVEKVIDRAEIEAEIRKEIEAEVKAKKQTKTKK